ncbi:glycosyltransferase [Xanthomarina sp. F2636L]|uniref:glycosyltransferase n=1 Tax=Xanthomarina sp. F2636L TaxID=2996018 RepID=UPI00225E3EF3|nr:glycosyltransferase [Xanthomarina sp. F2636L]MCX7549506.1 glycosyltransferase [Xanthomarina sp. F2636L]
MKTKKLNIVFVIPSLRAGGAERILSFVAQNLDANKFKTTLLVIGYEKDAVYHLSNLNIVYLNKSRVLKSFFSIFSYLKQNKPDVIVSSIVHLNVFIAIMSPFFRKTKIVAREASVLSILNKYDPSSSIFFSQRSVSLAYKLVDCIICQSKDMQEDMVNYFKVPKSKTHLINNPIANVFELKTQLKVDQDILRLITIGRLSKEKGYLRIIDALAQVDFPFHYTIIGDGPEKDIIFDTIEKHGLTDKIDYIEFTNEVDKYLTKSDLFLQGSYVDGFPNALIESCVVGTPVLAFHAPGGLSEIIENGKNGIIVNSNEEFINQLKAINTSYNFSPKIVSNIVKERFGKEKIISQYESLFLNLTNSN